MTWDATKPADNESPGLAPAQIRDNWSRLFTMINSDHIFNSTAMSNDGYHNVVHWVTKTSSPSYINSRGLTFAKNATVTLNAVSMTSPHLFHRTANSSGSITRENPITPVPILSFVNFEGITAGADASQTIRSSYNVTSVTRVGAGNGHYKINFSPSLPSDAYGVSVTGMSIGDGEVVIGCVIGKTSYTDIVKVGSIEVAFSLPSGVLRNVRMGNVIVFGG